MLILAGVGLIVLAVAVGLVLWQARQRHLGRWVVHYVLQAPRRRGPAPGEEMHLLLCIADHYEPNYGNVSAEVALARVARWAQDYPRNLGHFADSDGRKPRHTF